MSKLQTVDVRRLAKRFLFLVSVATCLVGGWVNPVRAAVTGEQRKQLTEAEQDISGAGKLYAAGKYADSAKQLGEAQDRILKLMETKDAGLWKLVQPQYRRLEKAHALLELEGAELKELPTWEALTTDPAAGKTDAVSFAKDIAPFLVTQCGNCHVNNRRGKFSMATFNDLMTGVEGRKVIQPGGGKGSRLAEVIEGGEMPPNGKVPSETLAKLVAWIDAGAKFDGPDPAASLLSYARAGAASTAQTDGPTMPTGKETVKFSTDIAPILLENCIGCHINARRAEGGFSMDNFAAMSRGGMSGKVLNPGKPEDSLLVKKLRGMAGQRMPAGGRPALSEEKITLISTWIRENATYDAGSTNIPIESVVSAGWAASATHSELLKRRTERAQSLWKKVLPTSEPSIAANDELVVLGNITQSRADEWLAAGVTAMNEVRKQLRLPSGGLVKGGVSIFVYKGRYDYSEFGRMNENRKLPASWQGHWRTSPLDVYVAMVDDTALDAKQQTAQLVQQLTGAYVGSLPQVPEWFAEGVARNVAIATAPRGDARIELWKRSLPAAAAMVDKSETLLQGKLDDEASGLVGMKLTSVMMDRRNRKGFDSLMQSMRDGKPFPEALSGTFGPPDKFVKLWLGR